MTSASEIIAQSKARGISCGCGHDHVRDHDQACEHGHKKRACPTCGNLSDGVGHGRSLGRAGFAAAGGIFILNSYLLTWLTPQQVFSAELSAVIGAVVLAIPIISAAIKDLLQGRVYMNELVALAILAAFTGGNFQTAGIIAFFLLITIIIESHTASGAQRSIEALIRLTPHSARRVAKDGSSEEVDVSALSLGDVIRVRPGDNFPIDGVIVSGQSAVNQASITGESLPVDKAEGDDVFAGTQNLSGAVDVKVTRLGKDTTLGKVKDMILAAEHSRTPIVRIIDRYAKFYTPTILMLAAITWWLTPDHSMSRVITLLVIACPCAVVLATPTTVVAAVAAAARLGILIKNVSHLELAARIRTFVFDKTGTLTEGELSVSRLNPAEGVEPAELLLFAASAEANSSHPTAKSLVRLANEVGVKPLPGEGFTEVHGKGVEALVDGRKCAVGRGAWLKSIGVAVPDDGEIPGDENAGMSVVHVARDGKAIGWIGFKDKIRDASSAAISQLKTHGVKHCAMVTGDRASVAAGVSAKLGLDEFKAECLPEGKVEFVQNLRKHSLVAVVGDGVNDAPALAAGDLGIAMGAIGSDIAINSASIALMTNDLKRIPLLLTLSRRSSAIINQNLFFGLVFIIAGIILSVFGYMNPIAAAVLHTSSTLIVIFNSARLVRTGEEITFAETMAKNAGN